MVSTGTGADADRLRALQAAAELPDGSCHPVPRETEAGTVLVATCALPIGPVDVPLASLLLDLGDTVVVLSVSSQTATRTAAITERVLVSLRRT